MGYSSQLFDQSNFKYYGMSTLNWDILTLAKPSILHLKGFQNLWILVQRSRKMRDFASDSNELIIFGKMA
jgi:hypothetical protein